MKNNRRGGLMSLIPSRGVVDPDAIVDEMDGKFMDDQQNKTRSDRAGKKVDVVAEDQDDVDAVDEGEGFDSDTVPPEKPLVTPLKIDMDTDEDEDEDEDAEDEVEPIADQESDSAEQTATGKSQVTVNVGSRRRERRAPSEVWNKHEVSVQHIKIDEIGINPNQPRRRFDKEEMGELVSSIEQHGILQPLVVHRIEEGYELVAGERRLRAAKVLGWERVPCVVRKDVRSDVSRLELALIENIQRQDLNALEEAMAYRQLNEEYGMTHEEIGKRVGRSRVGITNTIRILQLPPSIQRGLIEGKISAGHARAILMIPDEKKQFRFYQHMVEEGLTVRKAETRARRIQRAMDLDDPMRRKRKGRSAFEIKYSGLLEDRYGYDVRLSFNEYKNRYEIYFKCHSQPEINELLGRLLGSEPLPVDGVKKVGKKRKGDS